MAKAFFKLLVKSAIKHQAQELEMRERERKETLRIECLGMSRKVNRIDRARQEAQKERNSYQRSLVSRVTLFEKENSDQKANMHVAASDYYRKQDRADHGIILDNIERMDMLKDEIKMLKAAMDMVLLKEKETDTETRDVTRQLGYIQKEMDNVRTVDPNKVTRRAELSNQKLGMQLEENRRLVDQISHLEAERDKVLSIHKELDRDLIELSKNLADYTEQAKSTYDQRDMNRRSIKKLREHLEKSTIAFEQEMQNLQFKIDVLKRMEKFMTTKNKFRPDEGKERRLAKAKELTITEKDSIMFSSLMDKIRSDLQEDDLHVIVKTFIELEEENYMLFKNISETRDACHYMQIDLLSIQDKIKKMHKDKQREELERMERKAELLEKIEHCKTVADKKEEYIVQADNVIQTYIKGVLAILNRLGYKQKDIDRLAGVYKVVEERNIRVFLSEVEKYVNKLYDIKTTIEFLAWDKARRQSAMLNMTAEPLPPRLKLVQRVVVVPPLFPETEEFDDGTMPAEASFRPLTTHEMKYHVVEELENREGEEPNIHVPAPTMQDPASEAIGDTPKHLAVNLDVDIF